MSRPKIWRIQRKGSKKRFKNALIDEQNKNLKNSKRPIIGSRSFFFKEQWEQIVYGRSLKWVILNERAKSKWAKGQIPNHEWISLVSLYKRGIVSESHSISIKKSDLL